METDDCGMKETVKLLKNYPEISDMINGEVIDIGCGDCPVTPDCVKFDAGQGDANHITRYVKRQFDVVFSSHCLEHMTNPYRTIKDWWNLVKTGGMMIVAVPDEDLYEQGVFPSRWNFNHKWTFTINKKDSWSSRSINVVDIVRLLDDAEVIMMKLQDDGYDYSKKGIDQMRGDAMAQIILIVRKIN